MENTTKITFKTAEKVVELEKIIKRKEKTEMKILRKIEILLASNQCIDDPVHTNENSDSPPPTPGATAKNDEEAMIAIDNLCKELKEGNDDNGEQTPTFDQEVNSKSR